MGEGSADHEERKAKCGQAGDPRHKKADPSGDLTSAYEIHEARSAKGLEGGRHLGKRAQLRDSREEKERGHEDPTDP